MDEKVLFCTCLPLMSLKRDWEELPIDDMPPPRPKLAKLRKGYRIFGRKRLHILKECQFETVVLDAEIYLRTPYDEKPIYWSNKCTIRNHAHDPWTEEEFWQAERDLLDMQDTLKFIGIDGRVNTLGEEIEAIRRSLFKEQLIGEDTVQDGWIEHKTKIA